MKVWGVPCTKCDIRRSAGRESGQRTMKRSCCCPVTLATNCRFSGKRSSETGRLFGGACGGTVVSRGVASCSRNANGVVNNHDGNVAGGRADLGIFDDVEKIATASDTLANSSGGFGKWPDTYRSGNKNSAKAINTSASVK